MSKVPDASGRASHRAAIALGSNLPSTFGAPMATLRAAISEIAVLGNVLAVSRFHETEPVGYAMQPRFLNAALLLDTELEPVVLMEALLEIERRMGRDRSATAIPKGPRTLDLDLLLFDDLVLQAQGLTLPHPEMTRRRFVLEPLAEIAPELLHPLAGISIRELLARL